MDQKEYAKRDADLSAQIAGYKESACEHELQAASDRLQASRLESEREMLRGEFNTNKFL